MCTSKTIKLKSLGNVKVELEPNLRQEVGCLCRFRIQRLVVFLYLNLKFALRKIQSVSFYSPEEKKISYVKLYIHMYVHIYVCCVYRLFFFRATQWVHTHMRTYTDTYIKAYTYSYTCTLFKRNKTLQRLISNF